MNLMRTNIQGFKKDQKTNVLINTDLAKIENTKQARKTFKQTKNLENRISKLEEELKRMDKLINQLYTRSMMGNNV